MADFKLYIVTQMSGSYDGSFTHIIGICDTFEKATEMKERADRENIVLSDDCFSIIPEDVFYEWPYDEDTYEFAKTYQGFTSDQRQQQENRYYLMTEEYSEARIEEYVLNEYIKRDD